MEELLSIGPIRLSIKWIYIVIGLVFAYYLVTFRVKKAGLNIQIVETIVNSLFYGLIIWKLSYVLFYPTYAFRYPVGILYFHGGQKGFYLAVIIVLLYMTYNAFKEKVSVFTYLDLYFHGWLVVSFAYFIYMLEQNIIYYTGQIFLAMVLFLIIALKGKQLGNRLFLNSVILVYVLFQILLQYYSNAPVTYFSFTTLQVILVIIALLTIVIRVKLEKDV